MLQLPPIFPSQHIHPKKSIQQAKKSKSSEVSLGTTFQKCTRSPSLQPPYPPSRNSRDIVTPIRPPAPYSCTQCAPSICASLSSTLSIFLFAEEVASVSFSSVHSIISHSTLNLPLPLCLEPQLLRILPSLLPCTKLSNHGRPSLASLLPVNGTFSIFSLSCSASSTASFGSRSSSSRSRRSSPESEPSVREM